jgi:hypothetical protein
VISHYVGVWTRSAVRHRARYVYRTGQRWLEGANSGKEFPTKEEAEAYLEENRAMMEAALTTR